MGVPERLASPDAGDLRLWLLHQLRIHLEDRLIHGAMLVTLDDLQWADPSTLRALRSLLPDLASYPVVWMLARTSDTNDTDLNLLYEVLEQESANRMVLEPLNQDAVIEIAEDVLGAAPDADLLTLAEGAGGNPFLLVELLDGTCHGSAVNAAAPSRVLLSTRSKQ